MDPAVGLVRAYLELSGYFVLSELPVRRRIGREVIDVTDLDILAIRFPDPHRRPDPRSSLDLFLRSDEALDAPPDSIDLIIGEVKEGKARLNDALAREETIAFALRRVGCCPEEEVPTHARAIARGGSHAMRMGVDAECRGRLVVFAGKGEVGRSGVTTIPLEHCADQIRNRLHASGGLLLGARFKDSTLAMLALLEKVTGRRPASAAADHPPS